MIWLVAWLMGLRTMARSYLEASIRAASRWRRSWNRIGGKPSLATISSRNFDG